MADRARFLADIRAAIGRPPGDADRAAGPSAPIDHARAAQLRAPSAEARAELLAQLERTAPLQGWTLLRAADDAEAARRVVEIAQAHGAASVVRSAHDVLERMAVEAVLTDAGLGCALLAQRPGGPDAPERQALAADAEVGVTGVDAVIAETATVAIVPRRGVGRQSSLLPPVHIAVADADQVVATLDDALLLRQEAQAEAEETAWYMNLISGPSRTGDIEQTLVVGVHGPGVVYLVVIGD